MESAALAIGLSDLGSRISISRLPLGRHRPAVVIEIRGMNRRHAAASIGAPTIKPRHAAALALVGWCLLNSSVLWAQDKTFVAPDGSFSFRYRENLVHCKQLKNDWEPADNCTAYASVCDDLRPEDQTSLACFAYPRNKFTESPSAREGGFDVIFGAATFSVETLNDEKTEKGCLAARPELNETSAGSTRINAVRFAIFDTVDVGTGHTTEVRFYRTFHQGKCYQLGVNLATSTGDFEPDPPFIEFTKSDQKKISGTLQQARESFRFLK